LNTVQVAEAPVPVGLHLLLEAKLEADHWTRLSLGALLWRTTRRHDDELDDDSCAHIKRKYNLVARERRKGLLLLKLFSEFARFVSA
jgi:hypothetical protein